MNDLKAEWQVLNERLIRAEQLNRRIIREMILKKTDNAHRKLFRYERFWFILGIMLFFFYGGGFLAGGFFSFRKITCGFIALSMVFSSFPYLWSLRVLKKFDINSLNLVEANKWIIQYKLWIKKILFYNCLFGVVIIFIFFYLQREVYPSAFIVGFVVFVIIWGVTITWGTFRIYGKKIRDIEDCLVELKELQELTADTTGDEVNNEPNCSQ